jgi:hypothetical protein
MPNALAFIFKPSEPSADQYFISDRSLSAIRLVRTVVLYAAASAENVHVPHFEAPRCQCVVPAAEVVVL